MSEEASVLVVEDDQSLRLLCRLTLEFEDFRVREAGTADEAREAVAESQPDVVFLDVNLGGKRSDTLLEDLRAAGIPVVVVTGSTDVEEYRSRADDVLSKPFEPSELVDVARRHGVR